MRQLYRLTFTTGGGCRLAACVLLCAIAGCGQANSATAPSSESAAPKEDNPTAKTADHSPRCPFSSKTAAESCPAKQSEASQPTSSNGSKVGVLLVSHGSHSEGWRKMMLDIEQSVRDEILKSGRVGQIRSAFMEYTEPSIATQLKAFDQEGLTDVILVPLLLTVSSHSFDDIPTIIGQKRDHLATNRLPLEGIEMYKPKAKVCIAPLLDFPAVLGKNVVRRVRQMSKEPAAEGVVLVAYGDKQYDDEWKRLLQKVGNEIRRETSVDCVRHSWCGHVVQYKSEPTVKAIREVLQEKQRAIVVPVLVGMDEMFQGKIIGGAIKEVDAEQCIVYRHDAILPDENINRWVVDISIELASKLTDQHATAPNK